MARAAQSRNDVYTGMLALICVAMLVGIFALVLEASEYDWVQKSPTTPGVTLPKSEPLPEAGAAPAGGAAAEPARGPVAAAPTPAAPTPEPPAPAAGLPAKLPEVPVVTADVPRAEAPAGPTPSPLSVPTPSRSTLPAASGPTPSPLTIPPPGGPARR
jgi:hypothetical protein